MGDLSKLCIHTITTKPWTLEECLSKYQDKGIGGVSVWQNVIEEKGPEKARELIDNYSLDVVSYVRGGFFPSVDPKVREEAIAHNKKLLDEASIIGAPLLVLVCGAEPKQSLQISRAQIQDGIEALIPYARSVGVKLAIEPLHPMYADTRSAVNTLEQANDMAEAIGDEMVGIAVDVYHLWWEADLQNQILRCGKSGNLLAYHICDWKSPTVDMLNDRGLMGEGCIPIKQISSWVQEAGFDGYIEVEIFSDHYWSMDQDIFLDKIIDSYQELFK